MITTGEVDSLRTQVESWRRGGNVAFVPTMGNLHAGHLSLIEAAHKVADRVVASIFVNPLQFGAGEDFDNYPRTLERDAAMLAAEGTDLLFAPSVRVMYPKAQAEQTRVEVPGLSDVLCGACRPGHFVGVATVVCKLFNMVQPDIALFGNKDYQQLMVIRRMTRQLALPIEIVAGETSRAEDGLALSSRNGYLDAAQRAEAVALARELQGVVAELRRGRRDWAALEAAAMDALATRGWKVDYVAIRRQADLGGPADGEALVVLGAARIGSTRLIDNVEVGVAT